MSQETAIIFSDVHFPHQDDKALGLLLKVIKDVVPERIYIAGDLADFYAVSDFNKAPGSVDSLQAECNQVVEFLGRLRDTAPDADIFYTEGNHEERMERWRMKNPEMYSMEALYVPEMFRLSEFNIEHKRYKDHYVFGNMRVTHGSKVRQHSAYSAKAELEACFTSGVSGHTHRISSHYTTKNNQTLFWHELGCMCDLNPEYATEPNWQQGFAIAYCVDGQTHVSLIPIIDHRAVVEGVTYYGGSQED